MDNEKILNVICVGAGFSGIYTLWKLRQLGFSVLVHEYGSDLGGVWHWNCYPGAKVDCELPVYQFRYILGKQTFEWKSRFPGRDELVKYFHHLDKHLGLSRDIMYNTKVIGANWDSSRNIWMVRSSNKEGNEFTTLCHHLILCTGFSSKAYIPDFPGMDSFKGQHCHSSRFPQTGIDFKGKKVSIVGTGATGIQIIQEIGPIVDHLTVYQRTPNLAIPMRQHCSSYKIPNKYESEATFKSMLRNFTAVQFNFTEKAFHQTDPKERKVLYESLWKTGGFAFWLANFKELITDIEVNNEVYAFWLEKTRPRILNDRKRELLAPLRPPHPFGTKRPGLEETYYEVFNQENVDIFNLQDSPIIEITSDGIRTRKEGVIKSDILIYATGFDANTGGILQINVKNEKGLSLKEYWENGTRTHLGMMSNGFPNLFWMYGPQATTKFSNGPTCAETQGDWIADLLVKMRSDKKIRVEPKTEAETKWVEEVHNLWNKTLCADVESFHNGSNIPGKFKEPLNYFGGFPEYVKRLEESKISGYKDFNMF